ncbi:MAG: OmpA family protein [Saprospiraceae bacterium]
MSSQHHVKLFFFLLILGLGGSRSVVAQSDPLHINDFVLSGATKRIGDRCFRLTEAIDWTSGSIWYRSPIRLDASFTMELNLMLGCDDRTGADGMVFAFSPYSQVTGHRGEGMGFSGLYPSLGIEIDTWQNEHLSDPPEDHVAILQHGYVDHLFNLEGPVVIKNVEDCLLHAFTIHWDEPSHTLSMMLDGRKVISYQGDLVNQIFDGNPLVYWGVTAATGQYNNRQEICFEKLDFTLPILESRYNAVEIGDFLTGKTMTLAKVTFPSGSTRLDKESEPELYKLLQLMQTYPGHKLIIQGHTDDQGPAEANRNISRQRAQSIADFLISHGIDRRRIEVQGLGEEFPEFSNQTATGRLKNRRITVQLYKPRA